MREFDFDFIKKLKEIKGLIKKFPPNRSWFLNITLWDDTDYKIKASSGWGGKIDIIEYQKSIGKIKQFKNK